MIKVLGILGTVSQTAHATGKFREDVRVLMYETDASLEGQSNTPLHFFKERSEMAGLKTTVYGNNLDYRGFGDKYQSLRPLLEIISPDTLIILADARDVALNVPRDEDMAVAAIEHFVENFKRVTKNSPNAVVVSAEAQCCVSAMSHAHPGEYFDSVTGKRNKRACSSGHIDCLWEENENIFSWVDFMHERASDATGLKWQEVGDVYLNAGLMAGYPQDLINLLNAIDIHPSEDDQAVLTGLMYANPEKLVLDYGQEMFGNGQWTRGVEDGCIFEGHGSESPLSHLETQTQPLLIHTPGKFYACLDILIEALGGQSQQRYHPDTRKLFSGRLSLAAQLGFGGAASVAEKEEEDNILAEAAEAEIEEEEEEDPDMYSTPSTSNSNYGQYGNFGNYVNYNTWFGQYGDWWINYGRYVYWGDNNNYGRRSRRRRTV